MTGSHIPDKILDRDTQLRLLLEVDASLPAGPPITVRLVGRLRHGQRPVPLDGQSRNLSPSKTVPHMGISRRDSTSTV